MTTLAKWLQHPLKRQVTELGTDILCDQPGVITIATEKVTEIYAGPIHKTIMTFTTTPITVTDDSGQGQYGGAVTAIYTFPAGCILFLGAVIDGSVTLGTTGTITNTWAGVVALGSVTSTTGSTLTGTEGTFMPSTAIATASSKVSVVDAVSSTNIVPYDGTTTSAPLFFNLLVTDESTHTSGTGTFTGTITVTWINLGDK
jgi:hypothetical protein